jgi:acyl carrier protein
MTAERPSLQALLPTLIELLQKIAPELEASTLRPEQPLRQQLDLDSIDWLNFLISVHQHFGVEIAETDYAQLQSLNDLAAYVQGKRG